MIRAQVLALALTLGACTATHQAPAPLMPPGAFFNEMEGYDSGGHDDPRVLEYLDGAGEALLSANVELRSRGLPYLYCPPAALRLSANNYREIVDKSIAAMPEATKREGEKDHWEINFILLEGLKKTFPCPTPSVGTSTPQEITSPR